MKKILFILVCILTLNCYAQKVVTKSGNTLTSVQKEKKQSEKTELSYVDKDGKSYPVYKSSKGKYYYLATSKKTGSEYRVYLDVKE